MVSRYQNSIVAILLFVATSSFADLPPLPTLPPLPISADVGATSTPSSQPKATPAISIPQAQKQETQKPVIASPDQAATAPLTPLVEVPALAPSPTSAASKPAALAPASATPTPTAPTIPTSVEPNRVIPAAVISEEPKTTSPLTSAQPTVVDSKKAPDNKSVSKEEHESFFIDTGKTKLPRISPAPNPNPVDYNAADLGIVALESDAKAISQDKTTPQSQEQATANTIIPDPHKDSTSDVASMNKADSTTTQVNDTPNVISTNTGQVTQPQTNMSPVALPSVVAAPVSAPSEAHSAAAGEVEAVTPPVETNVVIHAQKPEVVESSASRPAPLLDNNSEVASKQKDGNMSQNVHDATSLTPDHIKFITDESIMFTLPDDEVELGVLTEDAKIAQMPGKDYIKLFWQNYMTPQAQKRKEDVDMFLAMYETYSPEAYADGMNIADASNQAFDAASSGKLSDLRAIMTYYPVLQIRDIRGDTMLNVAIESDNIDTAKFLLIRGIDLRAVNYEGDDALSIANAESNSSAVDLVRSAKGGR